MGSEKEKRKGGGEKTEGKKGRDGKKERKGK